MYRILPKLFVLWSLIVGVAFSQSSLQEQKRSLQVEIEKQINDFLLSQLQAGEFFVYALVDIQQRDDDTASSNLPYSIQIPKGVLRKIIEEKAGEAALGNTQVKVTLGFDNRIPQTKRDLLAEVVSQRFDLNGESRTLEVKAMELVSSPIKDSERFALEKARMDSENALLKIEVERSRLEIKKKELEILRSKNEVDQVIKLQKEKEEAKTKEKDIEEPAGEPGDEAGVTKIQLSPAYNIAKDFQLAGIITIIGLVLVAGIVFAGFFFLKGMNPLSDAIMTVGTSIEAAATAGSSSTSTAAGSDASSSGSSGEVNTNVSVETGGLSGVPEEIGLDEEYTQALLDKIEILTKEKNFNFLRIFIDFLESSGGLPMAASILVSLSKETASLVIDQISVEQVARLKTFLSAPGNLAEAKKIKPRALSTFYGQIAIDEFSNSPLMKVTDLSWLTKMSSKEMSKFVVSLAENERAIFLAALSPERTKILLREATSDVERESIFGSLVRIDSVTEVDVVKVLNEISKRMESSKTEDKGVQGAVNASQYIADVAKDLEDADQRKLMDLVKDDDLRGELQKYFVPFSMVSQLPKNLITEIFSEHSDHRISQILYAANDEVRTKVIDSLPEIRAESVKDELKVLDDDKFYASRHKNVSVELQKEISVYLQKLNDEGLLQAGGEEALEETLGGVNAA